MGLIWPEIGSEGVYVISKGGLVWKDSKKRHHQGGSRVEDRRTEKTLNKFGFVRARAMWDLSSWDTVASRARLLSPLSLSRTSLIANPLPGGLVTQAIWGWGRVRGWELQGWQTREIDARWQNLSPAQSKQQLCLLPRGKKVIRDTRRVPKLIFILRDTRNDCLTGNGLMLYVQCSLTGQGQLKEKSSTSSCEFLSRSTTEGRYSHFS